MILGYTRISRFERESDRREQEEKLRIVAEESGARAFDFALYDDTCSATTPLKDRDGGAKLLKEMKPGDTIAALSLCRLFCSASDTVASTRMLREKNVDLIIVELGQTPVLNSRLFVTLADAFAKMDSLRVEAMHDARAMHARNGRHAGGHPPYGYRLASNDGSEHPMLEPEPSEQAVIALVKELYEQFHGPQYIMKELERRNIRNRANGKFQYVSVQRMVEKINAANGRRA